MALSNRVNIRGGGGGSSAFPWDVKSEGGWDRTSVSVASGTEEWCYSSILSPKIESGCNLQYSITPSNTTLKFYLMVSTDNGSTWTTVAYYDNGGAYSGVVSLSNYADNYLKFRIRCINYGSATITASINTLNIIK